MKEIDKCPNCGSPTDYWHTARYLKSGEAVCECKNCGYELMSSKNWRKEKCT